MAMRKVISMSCPICGGRAFDTDTLPDVEITVAAKCPNCGRFVDVPLTEGSVLRKPPTNVNRKRALSHAEGKREKRIRKDP